MTVLRGNNWELHVGDCLGVLPTLPACSVHAVVTSPPYFALRSYLPKGHPDKPKEIGSEHTVEAFIKTMVDVFRDVRRVLRDDGVCWINLGDGYNQYNAGQRAIPGTLSGNNQHARPDRPEGLAESIRIGNLLNIPHRVAEALRQDGWIWRQTIVWAKRSCMPESVSGWRWQRCRVKIATAEHTKTGHKGRDEQDITHGCSSDSPSHQAVWADCPGCTKCESTGGYVLRRGSGRCTTAHEYLFLMVKSNRYFWDSENSKERAVYAHAGIETRTAGKSSAGFAAAASGRKPSGNMKPGSTWIGTGSRNPRSVWTLSSEPTKVKHFAAFPSELVRRCLAPLVSPYGCCPECGSQWAPVVETCEVEPDLSQRSTSHYNTADRYGAGNGGNSGFDQLAAKMRSGIATKSTGYRPTCSCGHTEHVPCTVLDPFAGIGTTLQTAVFLGHHAVGCELNAEYADAASRRVDEPPRWHLRKVNAKHVKKRRQSMALQRELF